MNMTMRSVDALGVLSLRKEAKSSKTKFVVLYSTDGTDSVDEAMELGASYCLRLPIDRHYLAGRLETLRYSCLINTMTEGPSPKHRDFESEITDMLHMLAIPAHIKSYQYLRESISLVSQDMDLINSVTKELYPMVAKRFGTTPSCAERAIRHAI